MANASQHKGAACEDPGHPLPFNIAEDALAWPTVATI